MEIEGCVPLFCVTGEHAVLPCGIIVQSGMVSRRFPPNNTIKTENRKQTSDVHFPFSIFHYQSAKPIAAESGIDSTMP